MPTNMKCPNCGGQFTYLNNEYGYVCESCGTHREIGNISDNDVDLLNLANARRIDDYAFESALEFCKRILDKDPKNQEANWCALLAAYQVIYLKNDEEKFVPTFLNPEVDLPITQSEYYYNLNARYRHEADVIEDMRQQVVEQSKTISDYDVFISYKQHDRSNGETEEAAWAEEIYKLLGKSYKGSKLRVFLDKKALDESNAGWEPHIYAALRSAKVMVLLASSLDNLNSTWVKNEWKRFIAYKKTIIVVGAKSKVDPTKLPENAMRAGQMINAESGGWQKKTHKRVFEAINKSKDVSYLLYEADCFIQKKKFKKAKSTYQTVCDIDPKNAQAYWGLLKCKLKAFDDYDVVKSRKKLGEIDEFNNALRYANDTERAAFERVQRAQLNDQEKRNLSTDDYPRHNRNAWLKWSKPRRVAKRIAIVLVVCMLGAFGVYSYFGITQPISYTVKGNEATLSGTSIYFNLVVDDLNVDKYKDYYVVGIDDGVLKNSSIKTVSLGDQVTEIGDSAFEGSKKLSVVNIASNSISIGDYAFKDCVSLSEINIGQITDSNASNKVKAVGANVIGNGAFQNCTSLKSVSISNCAYIGANAFSGCKNLSSITLDISDDSTVEPAAFDSIGQNVEVKVPTVSEAILSTLKVRYSEINFATYTRDRVEECGYFISKLNHITHESASAIEKAEALYNALSDTEKTKITNYGILQNSRAAYNVAAAIQEIGEITLESGSKILAAESVYDSLTAEQKTYVANYSELQTARAVYNTMDMINQIGTVTLDSEVKIVAAENVYLALSYEQRDLVRNYNVLSNARAQVDVLASNAVIDMIGNIGLVTTESEALISRAEEAYSNLTDNQKAKVANYDTLTDARSVYTAIKAIDNIGTVTASSGTAIQTAEALYNTLTAAQKLKVINYSDLAEIKVAYNVVLLISKLDTVTAESQPLIAEAETAYTNLTESQKSKVSNYTNLTNAKVAYSAVLLIGAIGNVTLGSGTKIEAALSSYSDLTPNQQNMVGNSEKLADAVKVYDVLTGINELGDITLASESAISAVESGYNALNSAQKSMITNYGALTAARAIYTLETVVHKLGTLVLGSGTEYNYKTLTTVTMVSELNNVTTRNAIDSVTREGFNLFTAAENSAFFAAFPNFEIVRYDLSKEQTSGEIYEIPSSCASIGLIGNHTYTYTDTQIKFESRYSNVKLELRDFNIVAPNGLHAIDASEVSSQFTVAFSFVGSVSIKGAVGDSGSNGSNFSATSSNRTGTGGAGSQGRTGTCGIVGNSVNINVATSATVTIEGGAGGIGGAGGNSDCYSHGLSGNGNLGAGGKGGSGGTGGDGIYVASLNITNNGSISIKGGDGGKGGTGGTGASDPNYGSAEPDNGGDGGDGGVGGTGGYGIRTNSIAVANKRISVIGGTGGKGGTGGSGGTGDTESPWYPNGSYGGDGGTGGTGGKGGSSININCNNANLTAGNGGAGGDGGALGVNRHNSKRNGSNGASGKNGDNGNA